jgi:hypothetical protein
MSEIAPFLNEWDEKISRGRSFACDLDGLPDSMTSEDQARASRPLAAEQLVLALGTATRQE